MNRRLLVLLCAGSASLLLAATAARPAWIAIKSWRAARLSDEAARFAAENSLEVAIQKGHAAYLLDRNSASIVRQLAELASRSSSARALDFWNELLALETSALSDYTPAIDAAARARRFDLGQQWLQAWTLRDPTRSLERTRAEVRLLAAAGNYAGCRDRLQRAKEEHGALPPELQLLDAQIRLARSDAKDVSDGVVILQRLGATNAPESVQALAALVASTAAPRDERLAAAAHLADHPLAEPAHRLMALVAMRAAGASDDVRLQREVRAWLEQAHDESLRTVGHMLLRAGCAAVLLEELHDEDARRSHDRFALRLEALLQAGRFRDVLQATSDAATDQVSAALALASRARAFHGLDDAENAKDSLRNAIEVATDEDLASVEQAIRQAGDAQLLFQYFETLSAHPRLGPLARAGAVSAAYDLRDEAALKRLLPALDLRAAQLAPEFYERALYLLLLEDARSEEAASAVEELFARSSEDVTSRLLLAFANARRGRADVAKRLTTGIDPAALADNSEKIMLAASGSDPKASSIASDDLLASERNLLMRLATSRQ